MNDGSFERFLAAPIEVQLQFICAGLIMLSIGFAWLYRDLWLPWVHATFKGIGWRYVAPRDPQELQQRLGDMRIPEAALLAEIQELRKGIAERDDNLSELLTILTHYESQIMSLKAQIVQTTAIQTDRQTVQTGQTDAEWVYQTLQLDRTRNGLLQSLVIVGWSTSEIRPLLKGDNNVLSEAIAALRADLDQRRAAQAAPPEIIPTDDPRRWESDGAGRMVRKNLDGIAN